MKSYLFLILTLISMTMSQAQNRTEQLVQDWQRAKAFTLEYIQAFPQDQFAFQPIEGERSFAAQYLHISDAIVSFICSATDKKPYIEMGSLEKSNETDAQKVADEVSRAYDFAISSIGDLTEEQLHEKVTLFGQFELTREQVIRKCFEHQTHHRAQTAVYLRLNGVVPPAMKLF